jgi:hypothetical protein
MTLIVIFRSDNFFFMFLRVHSMTAARGKSRKPQVLVFVWIHQFNNKDQPALVRTPEISKELAVPRRVQSQELYQGKWVTVSHHNLSLCPTQQGVI